MNRAFVSERRTGMRHTKFDYRSYHGKRTATDWLKWIALILAILAALAVAALLWGQKYFTYTDGGLRLTLPFLQQETPKPVDPGQVDVVVEEPEPKEDTSHPVEPPQPAEATAAAAVPLSALLDGSAATLAEQAGANSVVVEMKDAQGRLGCPGRRLPRSTDSCPPGIRTASAPSPVCPASGTRPWAPTWHTPSAPEAATAGRTAMDCTGPPPLIQRCRTIWWA